MGETRTLYGYWRSSAAYRVRIALNWKALDYNYAAVHLVNNGGEQHAAAYRAINPLELVPTLIDGANRISQSLAILEYLDEAYAQTAPLLPRMPAARARVRALAQAIACDTHPLNNLRVLAYLERVWGARTVEREEWMRHWMRLTFAALEEQLAHDTATGQFCHGDAPGMADMLLIPQIYNARRFALDLAPFPTLLRIDSACAELDAFARALPERQPDAPKS